VNSPPDYEPIEPRSGGELTLQRFLAEWRSSPVRLKIILFLYLVVAAFGGLYGGYALTSEYPNWITWSITLLILEPVGFLSLMTLVVILWPNSSFALLFSRAVGRAKLATILVALAFACVLGWAGITLLLEWLRGS
jgi:hypothetical protein